ncbi:MAG: ubiquitin-like small modifier protein 1 [Halorientalis sp.]
MHVTYVCYGTIRDAVGQKTVTRAVEDDATVADAVSSLGQEFTDLGPLVFDSAGTLRANINVVVDEEPIHQLDGMATPLKEGATVAILPSVAGGCRVEPTQIRRGERV